ncbi:MFS transporter [Nocardioides sp. Arc9.136]|uniref:MFS transporter n=1 Tax=Nocardioides sp. Arc9.136 TaxID=2996826 RepID=UPI002665D867|nr:MFS transporter [Nocardioides sp. Arc9.136]WKN50115.1 MFS transporter [Nocardioides sp. Arc9.136]
MGSTEHRGVVAAGTAVIAVTYGLVRFGYGLHLPVLADEFAISPGIAGAVAGGSFAGYCAAALLAHRLVARGHPRVTLWVAGLLAAAGSATVGLAWSAPALAAGVLVGGSGAGLASPALVAAVAATVRAPAADRAQAVVNSGTGLGVVAGGLLAAVVADQWRLLWLGFAVAALLTTWWADRRATWAAAEAGPDADRPGVDLSAVRPAMLAAVLAGAGSAAVWTFGRELLGEDGGMGGATTALLWAVLGGAGVLGAFSGDLVVRWGPQRAWTGSALVVAAATALLVAAPASVPAAAVALAAFGGGYVALSGVLIAVATRVVPRGAAQATAALFIALTAGQAVGAAGLGALSGATTPTVAFGTAAALVVASVAVHARQPSTPRPTPATTAELRG